MTGIQLLMYVTLQISW